MSGVCGKRSQRNQVKTEHEWAATKEEETSYQLVAFTVMAQ